MCDMKNFSEMALVDKKSHPAVQAHVNMMQCIIKRMAGNSTSCKQWCIVLITAMLTFSKGNQNPIDLSGVCLMPLILFCFLDCFYLGLERQMKEKLNNFIYRLNRGKNAEAEIFLTETESNRDRDVCEKIERRFCHMGTQLWNTIWAFTSFSVFPFYICLYFIIQYLK